MASASIIRNTDDPTSLKTFMSPPFSVDEATLQSSSSKGKERVVNDVTADEEYAAELQAAYLEDVSRDLKDFVIAERLGAGIGDETNIDEHQEAKEYRTITLTSSARVGLPGPSNYGLECDPGSQLSPSVTFPVTGNTNKASGVPEGPNVQEAPMSNMNSDLPLLDIRLILGDQFGYPTVYCLVCEDLIVGEPTLQTSCGHYYCVDCICDLVKNCTRDETLYPPKCCNKVIPHEDIKPFLTLRLSAQFESKKAELDVPSGLRVFCPTPTCSAFLGSRDAASTFGCAVCKISICSSCRQPAHPGEKCGENGTKKLNALAKEKHWAKCPGCKNIVERISGCDSMCCRCGTTFNYQVCACRG